MIKIFRPNGEYTATANNEVVVASYKKLIKNQDEKIAELTQEIGQLKEELESRKSQVRVHLYRYFLETVYLAGAG